MSRQPVRPIYNLKNEKLRVKVSFSTKLFVYHRLLGKGKKGKIFIKTPDYLKVLNLQS